MPIDALQQGGLYANFMLQISSRYVHENNWIPRIGRHTNTVILSIIVTRSHHQS